MARILAILSIGCGCVIGSMIVMFIAYLVTIGWYSGNDGLNTEILVSFIVAVGGFSGFLIWKKWKLKGLIVLLASPLMLILLFLLKVLLPYAV